MQHTRLLNAIDGQWRSYNFTSARLIGLSSLNVDLTYGVFIIMKSSVICFAIIDLSKLFLTLAYNLDIQDMRIKHTLTLEPTYVSPCRLFLLIHPF